MSAVKLILKRSSILGKRPTSEQLEAGELAVNNNNVDPGLFFKVSSTDDIVKVGPTSYLPAAPTLTPSKGELWIDSTTNQLSVGTNTNEWEAVTSKFLGGSDGYSVFVAPNYDLATDSIDNDGQAAPFQTLNRAIIEVSKQIVARTLAGLPTLNLYTIYLLNGYSTISNGPGSLNLNTFDVNFGAGENQSPVTQYYIQQFNHPEGGVIVPRGVSIVGLDLKKCEVRPTYIPTYKYPGFPDNYQLDPPSRINPSGGPLYNTNSPLSAVFRWSGETYLSNFSVRDKVEVRQVSNISLDTYGKVVFRTPLPHCLQYNDFIQLSALPDTPTSSGLVDGQYYVEPLGPFTFYLSKSSFIVPAGRTPTSTYITQNDINVSLLTISERSLYDVSNIYPYYAPRRELGVPIEPFELHNYSAHKLSLVKNASLEDLNLFYSKIQKAFPDVFSEEVDTQLATPQEVVIVAPTSNAYTVDPDLSSNLSTNDTLFASPYMNQVNHRSNYGMANSDMDGDLVSGFKSAIFNASTAVILQNDPCAYEIYNSSDNNWVTLTESVAQQLDLEIFNVPTLAQLRVLNSTSLLNIRFFYQTLGINPGEPVSSSNLSTGLTDINNDFRHFGFRVRGSGSYMQAQSIYTIGAAIGAWALNGAVMNLTNSTSNFGWTAIQAEGFAGIGTLGGATQLNKGFLQSGIVLPLSLSWQQAVSDAQKRILTLGSRVIEVLPDPVNPDIQRVYLSGPFDPSTILPYSLAPGTAVYVSDPLSQYRGFLATDGLPTTVLVDPVYQRPYLRVRASDSSIPYRDSRSSFVFGYAYIRRYMDPREETDKAYGLYIQSTNSLSQAPEKGSVIRLDQASQTLSNTLKSNVQLDPVYGGFNQVFTISNVLATDSFTSNFNYKTDDDRQSVDYAVYFSISDGGVPWIQALNLDGLGFVNFNNPKNSYATYNNKNFFAAENNLWQALYYEDSSNYTPVNGPQKVAPDLLNSPFVPALVTIRNIPVSLTYQGQIPDLFLDGYAQLTAGTVPSAEPAAYLRGATLPARIYNQFVINQDDSSPSTGILYNTTPTAFTTTTTTPSTTTQTAEAPTLWPPLETPSTPSFGRPQISSFTVSSVAELKDPKSELSVLRLDNGGSYEYVRVISLDSATSTLRVIRNYYPQVFTVGGYVFPPGLPETIPSGTTATVCIQTPVTQPEVYDPLWAISKVSLFRYYQIMGFSTSQLLPVLVPAPEGERIVPNTSIPGAPALQGYAAIKTAWPVEFNDPSLIMANTHTWTWCGYGLYSRGLPKYQSNTLPKKVSFDYLATSLWGGRALATGVTQDGDLILSGDLRDSITGDYYLALNPYNPTFNFITYDEINTFATFLLLDDISDQFDGVTTTFDLTLGGQPVLYLAEQLLVSVGGVGQIPITAYITSGSTITFTEAPDAGATATIRAIARA